MSTIPVPIVRYLIPCDDVVADEGNPHRVTLVGLVGSISAHGMPRFPVHRPELCVYVQLTECRGSGLLTVELVRPDDGLVVIRIAPRSVVFPADPLESIGVVFRLRNLFFPAAGLYEVRLWYNTHELAHQPIRVR